MRVGFDNGTVHPRSEPKIVRINDEPPQAASLAGRYFAGSGTRGSRLRGVRVATAALGCPSSAVRLSLCWLSAESARRLTVSSKLSYTREGAVRADAPQPGFDR